MSRYAEGRLIKTWAMRGTLHVLTPEEAGAFLSMLAAGRSWERPSWQRYFGMTQNALDRLASVFGRRSPDRPDSRGTDHGDRRPRASSATSAEGSARAGERS